MVVVPRRRDILRQQELAEERRVEVRVDSADDGSVKLCRDLAGHLVPLGVLDDQMFFGSSETNSAEVVSELHGLEVTRTGGSYGSSPMGDTMKRGRSGAADRSERD